jgi:hypothetical protein
MRIERGRNLDQVVFFVYYTQNEYFTVTADTEEQAREEIDEQLNEMIFGLKNLMLENNYKLNQL